MIIAKKEYSNNSFSEILKRLFKFTFGIILSNPVRKILSVLVLYLITGFFFRLHYLEFEWFYSLARGETVLLMPSQTLLLLCWSIVMLLHSFVLRLWLKGELAFCSALWIILVLASFSLLFLLPCTLFWWAFSPLATIGTLISNPQANPFTSSNTTTVNPWVVVFCGRVMIFCHLKYAGRVELIQTSLRLEKFYAGSDLLYWEYYEHGNIYETLELGLELITEGHTKEGLELINKALIYFNKI